MTTTSTAGLTTEGLLALCDKVDSGEKLTAAEKVAIVAYELDRRGLPSMERLGDLASRIPLTARQIGSLCRFHLDKLNAALPEGVAYEYGASEYRASGAGAFGRYSTGRRGCAVAAALYRTGRD